MSESLHSDEEIPPSSPIQPKGRRLNVVIFRKRKLEEVVEISSEDSSSETKSETLEEIMQEIQMKRTSEWVERHRTVKSSTASKREKQGKPESSTASTEEKQARPKSGTATIGEKHVKTESRTAMKKGVELQSSSPCDEIRIKRPKRETACSKEHKIKPKGKKKVISKKPAVSQNPRIRQRKQCSLCGSWQLNVWRHMHDMHGDDNKEQTEEKVVSKRGYTIKICPIDECSTIVERLRDHLIRKHRIPNHSRQLIRLLQLATPLKQAIEKKVDTSIVKIKAEKDTTISISDEYETQDEDESQDMLPTQPVQHVQISQHKIKVEESSVISISEEEPDDKTREIPCTLKTEKDSVIALTEENINQDETLKDETVENVDRSEVEVDPDKDKSEKLKRFNHNAMINKFIHWLMDPPSLKGLRESTQHGYQVYKIWIDMSPDLKVQQLLDVKKLHVWLDTFLKTMAPGTAKSYLSSLTIFIDFLVNRDLVKQIKQALQFKEDVKMFSRNLKKKCKLRRTVIETEEIGTMINPEDIVAFMESETAKECETILGNPPKTELVPTTFFKVRDYILLRLIQTNAQRPGAVRAITPKVLQNAKVTEDGAVLTVAEHKTAAQGPANLGLTPQLYRYLKNYTDMLRLVPNYVPADTKSIFIKWPGKDGVAIPMSSSHVNKSLNSIWSQGPIRKPISATRFRKATTTAVRSVVPASREVLARHMSHSAATADRYYEIHNTRKLAIPVTKLISSVMENPKKDVTKSVHWSMNAPEIKQIQSPTNETQQVNKDATTAGDSTDSYEYEQKTPVHKTSGYLQHGRRAFMPDEQRLLLELCKDLIKAGRVLKYDIIGTLQSSARGTQLLLKIKERYGAEHYMQKVVDRIKSEVRKDKREKQKISTIMSKSQKKTE